jgi:AraC-like DNA-binding protein
MLKMTEFYRNQGVEIAKIHACGSASFPRHTHAEYVISANLSGSEQIWVDGKDFHAIGESVTVYNPHAVQASTFKHLAGEAEFISLYVEPATLAELGKDNAWLSRSIAPEVGQGVFANTDLYRSILELYRSARDGSGADFDAALIELVAALLANSYYVVDPGQKSLSAERFEEIIEFMRANLETQASLEVLSEIGNVSKFHLIRSFKSAVGMPPAKYHMQLRLIEARRRLRNGQHVQDVAFDLGFYDQSHFINAFRKVMGVSPLHFATPRRLGQVGKPRMSVL